MRAQRRSRLHIEFTGSYFSEIEFTGGYFSETEFTGGYFSETELFQNNC